MSTCQTACSKRDTLRGILLDQAARHAERVYVRCVLPNGKVAHLTYGLLIERGSQFSHALRTLGVPLKGIAIIILPHSLDLYCAFFGAVLGGYIPSLLAVPSFKLSPGHYRDELEALLARIDARAVITDAATAEYLKLEASTGSAARLILTDRIPSSGADIPPAEVEPDDVVLLQHSSGSTGLKKGVALSNRSVLRQIQMYAPSIDLGPHDRIASWLPLYHDMGLIACAIMPAVLGVPVTALSPFHWITRPASLLRVIHADRCTLTWLPNFAYEFLATRVRAAEVSGLRLDSMRGWINCSEPTIAETHRRFLERFQPIGVRPETLWTCYAAAETTFAVSQSSVAVAPRVEQVARERFLKHGEALPVPDSSAAALELMSAGRLLEGTHVRITDERGEDLPERRVGEIAIRSDSLFSGYFKDPESTAAALRNGWYYSGDLGYLAEGHLFITGRKKDLIIIAGTNYYPQDIERIVSDVPGVHPGRVVAFGVEDASVGTQRLVVMAEVDDPTQIDSPDLTAAVRTAISERLDCVIHDLRLVPHMWLLKTSSGKIARGPNLRRYVAELAGKAREATGSSAP